ncbi:hypothetical protein D9M71_249670 [compost metagenome]
MALGAVFEAVDEAFLGGEAGNEVEVGLAGLDAELAYLVVEAGSQFELGDALALEHDFEDLRYGFLLEGAPVRAQAGAGQLRFDQGAVTGAVEAAVALAEAADLAVDVAHRALTVPEGEQGRLVEQLAEIDIVLEADQLQVQGERGAEGLFEGEGDHLE